MEKRILLAIFLSFLVLYVYQALFVPPVPPEGMKKLAEAPAGAPGEADKPAAPGAGPGEQKPFGAPPTEAAAAAAAAVAEAPAAIIGDTEEREIVVETGVARVVLTNRGARLLSWQLENYDDENGEPYEIVTRDLPGTHPRPLSFEMDDASASARANEALYRVSHAGSTLKLSDAPATITFEYQDGSGLYVRKSLTFEPGSYVFTLEREVRLGTEQLNPTIVWGPALGPVAAPPSTYHQKPQGMLHRSGKVERWKADDLREQPVQEAEFRYVGVDEHYFAVLALPRANAKAVFEPFEVPIPGSDERASFVSWGLRVARSEPAVRFFVGPKDFDILQQTDQELVRTINYGVFSWLAVPLLRALKGINAYVGNYGWSIIILTLLIHLVMFPLRHKSVVSMRRMQELQPQIKAIQERYGKLKTTDPARQKMNTELMNLYREKGVNPASGCLPLLITMPVLFAFYSLLSQAIEIRHAPFALWITDLSVHDPYYVTPIVMGATMLWQQKMTPTSADPAQQRMMLIMPLVFLFFFLWAPSGLVIYWLFSNLLAIAQQYLTNRLIGPAPVRAVRPPAERRLKRAGSGRTQAAAKLEGDRK